MSIEDLYKELLKHYGPQHWWPAETEWEVIVGAILTQNTAWKNVERAINNLKRAGKLDPEDILTLDMEELKTLIRPAGFYNQKAERLKRAAKLYLEKGRESTRDDWLSLKGIGRETADSIMLYAFDKPYFVVDAYTFRLFERLGIWEGRNYEALRKKVERALTNVDDLKEFHALIVEHCKRICKKKPLCDRCFLEECKFKRRYRN